VEKNALRRWKNVAGKRQRFTCLDGSFLDMAISTGNPKLVTRVLEVEKGKLCYIAGTVYMDMPLKPNVMEDVARDVSYVPQH